MKTTVLIKVLHDYMVQYTEMVENLIRWKANLLSNILENITRMKLDASLSNAHSRTT